MSGTAEEGSIRLMRLHKMSLLVWFACALAAIGGRLVFREGACSWSPRGTASRSTATARLIPLISLFLVWQRE